ncbi:protein reprimo-like [Limosa lapponica baueri]|uniref:Protein reprimo-like n=1 Tax=Limosa lapponica baueri TaxID=1758121 RepID=A0A2I0TC28_LIMLA|nr:protein reprimo-like [Limosa lapponica baueri]
MNASARAGAWGDLRVAEAAQIAIVLVLCLTVAFAVFFLGCNLLLQAESLAAAPAQERQLSREAEGATERV